MSRLVTFLLGPGAARRVWLLTIAMAAVGLAVHLLVAKHMDRPAVDVQLQWWLFAAIVAVVEFPQIRLVVKNEGHSFTLGELGLCLGLFVVAPDQLILAAGLGAGLAKFRMPPVKVAFNVALWMAQAGLALVVFHVLVDATQPFSLRGLVATFVAMATVGLLGTVAVSTAISLVQGRVRGTLLGTAATITMAVNVANTGLGLIGVYLIAQDPHLVVALIGPIAVLFLAYRGFVLERQQHGRLQLVYQTTRSVLEAPEIGAAVESVVEQAREVFRAEYAQIVLYPERSGEGVVAYTLGTDRGAIVVERVASLSGTVFAAVELTRRAERLRSEEVEFRGGLLGLPEEAMRHIMIAPLESERRVLGAIAVANRLGDATPFDASDLHLLETLAAHAGIAIGNGRLERTLAELTVVQDELARQVTLDGLTGLANRTHFAERLQSALDAPPDGGVGVIYVDLDDFKRVNDVHGHAGGDIVLRELATRLISCLREGDLAGRLGGDEFAVIVHGPGEVKQLERMAGRITRALEPPIALPAGVLEPGFSLGIALAGDVVDAETLLTHGDNAMYHAKRSGKGRTAVYDVALHDHHTDRAETIAALERAVERGELLLHYQPILSLHDRRVVGVEALVRWERPGIGLIPPALFLPLADESGLASVVGDWVVREACGRVARWNLGGVGPGDLFVSVNVSSAHAADPQFEARVVEAVHASGLRAEQLQLEITESGLRDARSGAPNTSLNALRDRGVRVALDDFGTGLSSLAGLSAFPVDFLKIPGYFMNGDGTSKPTMADALVTIGRTLEIPTIAESIETLEQVERLEALGCRFAQGHAFARAMPAPELELWLLAGGLATEVQNGAGAIG